MYEHHCCTTELCIPDECHETMKLWNETHFHISAAAVYVIAKSSWCCLLLLLGVRVLKTLLQRFIDWQLIRHVTRDDPVARLVTVWQWLGSWHKCHTDTGSITELDWNSLERWSIEQLLHLMSCCHDDGRAANVWNCRYRNLNTMQWEKYCKLQEIMIEDLAIEVNSREGWAQACT